MEKNDLQFGDIYTDPVYRGQGIAPYSIRQVVNQFINKSPKFWYVAEEKNEASVRLAEKLGFTLYGKGVRKSTLGIRAIGQYIILNKSTSN
jgi:RimJ/RimL family protein N-acetyltransferase